MKTRDLLLFALFGINALAETIKVPQDYPLIQAGINGASEGDTVLVSAGRYVETINFRGKAITVTSTAPRDSTVVAATIVEGEYDAPYPLVGFGTNEGRKSVFAGFTVRNGIAGVHSHVAGGIYCRGAGPRIENCVIVDCFGMLSGGIFLEDSDALISHCRIVDNHARYDGGGISVEGGSPTIAHCVIRANRGWHGAGIYTTGSTASVRNCLIEGNEAKWGGGVYSRDTASLDNCTVVGNMFTSYGTGGGIFGTMVVSNTIVRHNEDDQVLGTPSIRHSNIEGGYPGNGNIDADPLFRSLHGFDYLLGIASPSIDTGDPLLQDGISDRHPRWPRWYPNGARSDQGAYGGPGNAGWLGL